MKQTSHTIVTHSNTFFIFLSKLTNLWPRHNLATLRIRKMNLIFDQIVIFDSNFSSVKWIFHLLSNKCTHYLPVDCFCIVFSCGDMRPMVVWWATTSDIKSCRIKVFVVFCYLDGRSGLLSHFADVEASVGNFSKYVAMQQQPNVQSMCHKRRRKKWRQPRNKIQ